MQNNQRNLSQRSRMWLMLLAAFGVAAFVLTVVYFMRRVLPFGTLTVLRMDLYHQYGPLFQEFYERIKNADSLFYSWCAGLGSCFLGNYFNYLSSPIGLIVMLFGNGNAPEAIAAMILIKAGLSSASLNYYFCKSLKRLNLSTLAFGVMYAFSGYFLAYYWNVMWLDAMFLLPIVAYGIERIINTGKMRTYVIALSLTMFSNYYMSFMMCIFSVMYFFAYFYINYQNGARLTPEPEGKESFFARRRSSRFWRSGWVFAGGSLLAASIVAFALAPTFLVLQETSATSGTAPDKFKLYFNLFDFMANHFAGLDTTIRSSGDVVLPNIFSGMLTVILVPLFVMTRSISKKEKAIYIALLAIFYIGFDVNMFNYIWHGLHFPNDLPYRQSFMYSFILLVIAYKTFIRLKELTSRQIAAAGIGVLLFIIIAQKVGSKNVTDVTVYVSVIFAFFYTVLLIFFKDRRYTSAGLAALLLVCVCSENIIASTKSYDIDQTKANYASDRGDFKELKSYLDKLEEDKFYRMELSNLRTRMDPCWYYYNGVSIFSSMAYETTSSLVHNLGMYGNTINSSTYYPQTPVFNSMFSLKYVVNNTTPDVLENNLDYYTYVTKIDKFTAYENDKYLPIGFCVNKDVENWVYNSSDPFEVQGSLFSLSTGTENPFYDIPVSSITYNNMNTFTNYNTHYFSMNKTTGGTEGSFTMYLNPEESGNVYLYLNANSYYNTGAGEGTVSIEGPCGSITYNLDMDGIIDIGYQEGGEPITVTVTLKENSKDTGNLYFYACMMDKEVFNEGYKKLRKNQMDVTKFDDTVIEGTVSPKEDCILFTSIPYDRSWNVYVDGKKLEAAEYDKDGALKDENTLGKVVRIGNGLLGISLEKGKHEIKLEYKVNGLSAGIKISLMAVAVILLYYILKRVGLLKKLRRKHPAFPEYDYEGYSTDIFLKHRVAVKSSTAHRPPERELISPPVEADNGFSVTDVEPYARQTHDGTTFGSIQEAFEASVSPQTVEKEALPTVEATPEAEDSLHHAPLE